MRFTKILALLACFLSPLFAYETADLRFEVEGLSGKRLSVKAFDKNKLILNQITDYLLKDSPKSECYVEKIPEGYVLRYQGKDECALTLFLDDQGNMSLEGADQTHYQHKKSWGFKTSGKFINRGSSAFYKIFTKAKETHNTGILKAYSGHFTQEYVFNRGIIHFGDKTDYAGLDAYLPYLSLIDPEAEPHYQRRVIDDYGVILAEQDLKIKNFCHKIHGLMDIGKDLHLQEASLENYAQYNSVGPLIGTAHRIENHGIFWAGSINRDLQIREWVNEGEVYLRHSSDIFASTLFDNKSIIFGSSHLTVGCRKKPTSIGYIVAEGVIKALVEELMEEGDFKAVFSAATLFSKKRKIILDVQKHTDHYINTITQHYSVNRFGHKTLSHTTETGYIFQKRTTEKSQKEIETEGLDIPEELSAAKDALKAKGDRLQNVRQGLKEKLKKLGLMNVNKNHLLAALLKSLKEAGLDADDLKSLFEDEEIGQILNTLSAYEVMDERTRDDLLSQDRDANTFLRDVSLRAQRLGLNAWQWVKRNPEEVVIRLCDLANILALRGYPPAMAAAGVCGVGKIGVGAYKGLTKAQAFFNKKHEGGKTCGPKDGRITNPSKAESPVWKELKPYKGPYKTDANGEKVYKWDYIHNDIEVFNRRTEAHVGTAHPVTGEIYKPAVPGRFEKGIK